MVEHMPLWHGGASNYRDGNGEEPEEKKVQRQAQSGIQPKGRSQGLTLLLSYGALTKKDLA